jgi:hypothetical protein
MQPLFAGLNTAAATYFISTVFCPDTRFDGSVSGDLLSEYAG